MLASVIDTPIKTEGKISHKVTKDRKNIEEIGATKEYTDSMDKEAS